MAKRSSTTNSTRTNKRKDPFAKNGGQKIRAGLYDGSSPSSEFRVSGHSTGTTGTQMEAMSHQVSIDAGEIPAYPVETYFQSQNVEIEIDDDSFEDLGGPGLYGPSPNLLAKSPLAKDDTARWPMIALWSAVGLGGAAALSYAAYRFLNREK